MSLVAPETSFSMIREGISLYGYPPVATDLDFLPALRWESEVVYVKDISAGDSVSYGCTFTADKPMRVATVAVGYGDGYHRMISNRGQMLVGGKRANIIGRICMDQTMQFFATLQPGLQFRFALHFIHAPEPVQVPMLLKNFHGFSTDTVRRRIRHLQTQLFF